MAKTKKVTLDSTMGDYTGSKSNEIVTITGGTHNISLKKGLDKVIIDAVNDEFANISSSTINIGQGGGKVIISISDDTITNAGEDIVPIPKINFVEGVVLSYSVSANLSKALTIAIAKAKYDVECAEASIAGKPKPAVPSILTPFLKDGEPDNDLIEDYTDNYDLTITAKWGKKTTTVVIENYFNQNNNSLKLQDYVGNSTTGSVMINDGVNPTFNIISEFEKDSTVIVIKPSTAPKSLLKLQNKYYDLMIKKLNIDYQNALASGDNAAISKAENNYLLGQATFGSYKEVANAMSTAYIGTIYNNKINVSKGGIVLSQGKNDITIAKKSKDVSILSGTYDDNFTLNGFNQIVLISDKGSTSGNGNNFTIKNVNANDLHPAVISMSYSNTADDYMSSLQAMSITNSNGFNKYKLSSSILAAQMSLILGGNPSAAIKGLNVVGASGTKIFDDGGVISAGSEIVVDGKTSKGAGNIYSGDLQSAIKSQYQSIKEWGTPLAEWFTENGLMVSTLASISNKEINNLIKNNGITKKSVKKAFKKDVLAKKQQLLNILKSVYVGTSGDNSYTIGKKEVTIFSGDGNDTFTFKGTLSNKKDDRLFSTIYSRTGTDFADTPAYNNDKIVFTNYTFDNGSLDATFNPIGNGGVWFVATDNDKKWNFLGNHTVDYNKFGICDSLTLKDKSRTYEVQVSNSKTLDWTSENEQNINHIVYSKQLLESDTVNVVANGKYNRYYSCGNGVNYTSDNANSHDYINSSYNVKDSYSINSFSKNTTLKVVDSEDLDYDADKYDSFNMQVSDTAYKNLRAIFNINSNGDIDFTKVCLADKSKLTSKNVYLDSAMQGFALKTGITLFGVEEVRLNDNKMFGANQVDLANYVYNETWLDNLKTKVVSWLDKHSALSVEAVLESGNAKDINSLLKIYAAAEFTPNEVV